MSDEKRRRERFPISQEIELQTSEGQVVKAAGINVSEGGLLCRADKEIHIGTLVKFQLLLPTGKTSMSLSCEGLVLRCVETGGKFDVVVDFFDAE